MGNCLVTKLKGVVSNDNLETLGKYDIFLHQRDEGGINVSKCTVITGGGDLELTGNAVFTDSTFTQDNGKKVTNATNAYYYIKDFSADGTDKLIVSKYSNTGLNLQNDSIIEIKDIVVLMGYNPNFTTLGSNAYMANFISGDLEKALYNNREFIEINTPYSNNVVGSIENIVKRQYEIEGGVNPRTVKFNVYSSALTLNNATIGSTNSRKLMTLVIGNDTTVVYGNNGTTELATYTRATDSWSYTGN